MKQTYFKLSMLLLCMVAGLSSAWAQDEGHKATFYHAFDIENPDVKNYKTGDKIEFPRCGDSDYGWPFEGWVTAAIEGASTEEPDFVDTENTTMGEEDVNFYTVYSREVGETTYYVTSKKNLIPPNITSLDINGADEGSGTEEDPYIVVLGNTYEVDVDKSYNDGWTAYMYISFDGENYTEGNEVEISSSGPITIWAYLQFDFNDIKSEVYEKTFYVAVKHEVTLEKDNCDVEFISGDSYIDIYADGVPYGTEVTMEVTPDEHYHIASVKINDETLTAYEYGTYSFIMPDEDISIVVTCEEDAYELTIPDYGYATYYGLEPYIMPSDCKGYIIIKGEGNQNKQYSLEIAYESGSVVPEEMPLIIYSDTPGIKKLVFTDDEGEDIDNTFLLGTEEEYDIEPGDGEYYYVLANGEQGVGFYKNENESFHVGAHEALLVIDEEAEPYYLLPEYVSATISDKCYDEKDGVKTYYSTFSTGKYIKGPADVTVSEVGLNKDGTLKVASYATGDIVAANRGLLISSSTPGKKYFEIHIPSGSGPDETVLLGKDNLLIGTGDYGCTADEMDDEKEVRSYFYRLTMHKGTQIGFYWGAENGGAFALGANKAYMLVPQSMIPASSSNVKASFWITDDDATSISAPAIENNANDAIYNLNGQRVNTVTKGMYIKNGKKYFVK